MNEYIIIESRSVREDNVGVGPWSVQWGNSAFPVFGGGDACCIPSPNEQTCLPCESKRRNLQEVLAEVATNEDLVVVHNVPVTTHGGAAGEVETKDIVIGGSGALQAIDLDCSECSEDPSRPPGAPCSSALLVDAIVQFVEEEGGNPGAQDSRPVESKRKLLPTGDTPEATAVRAAASIIKCDSESCIVSHPKFVEFAEEKLGMPKGKIVAEVERNFKTAGPRNSTELLNNFQIDATLQRWSHTFPNFFPYPFAMMDFERNGDALGRYDIGDILDGKIAHSVGPGFAPVKRRANCAGCVVNTDVSSGPGKHWVAVFIDCRPPADSKEPWTVEYFNSAGRPPPKPMIQWMEKTKARLEQYRGNNNVETVAVTSISHQQSQTECGLYSCFYIRSRLENVPYSYFQDPKNIITDVEMTKFRQYVFRVK